MYENVLPKGISTEAGQWGNKRSTGKIGGQPGLSELPLRAKVLDKPCHSPLCQ